MFFTKRDREIESQHLIATKHLVNGFAALIPILKIILERLKEMPSRIELDKALESENKALQDAAERVQKQIAEKTEALQNALNNLQAKHESDDDFSAELAQVNQHIADLNQIAKTPLAASGQPPATTASTAIGAAGTTVGGPEMHAAAGGAEQEDPHAGSATTDAEPEVKDETSPPTPTPEPTGQIEWGTGENDGMVRDLPDGEWRSPTQKEINAKE